MVYILSAMTEYLSLLMVGQTHNEIFLYFTIFMEKKRKEWKALQDRTIKAYLAGT